jgi:hypothetical protein
LPARGWADGVVALAESYLAGTVASGTGGERFQVTVHADQDPLVADDVFSVTLEDSTNVSADPRKRFDAWLVIAGWWVRWLPQLALVSSKGLVLCVAPLS